MSRSSSRWRGADAPAGVLRVALLASFPLCVATSVGHAHLGHVVLRAERYLKVEVSPSGVRIVVSLSLGPDEARRIMSAADANHDRNVSPDEAKRYMRAWGEGLKTDLPVVVDGVAVDVSWGEAFLDPTGPVRRRPATVEMVAHIAVGHGRHRIRVRDRMPRRSWDRTDVAFRARGGARLIASGAEAEPGSLVRDLAFGPAAADARIGDVLTVDAVIPGRDADPLPSWVALLAALVLGLSVAVWRATRRSTTTTATGDRGS